MKLFVFDDDGGNVVDKDVYVWSDERIGEIKIFLLIIRVEVGCNIVPEEVCDLFRKTRSSIRRCCCVNINICEQLIINNIINI